MDFSEYVMKFYEQETPKLKSHNLIKIKAEDIGITAKAIQSLYHRDYERAKDRIEKIVLNENMSMYILLENNKIVGTASFEIEDTIATIFSVGILQKFRGRGLSKKLLSGIILSIQEKGINNIVLEVDSENEIAFNLYTKNGFNIIEQIDYCI